jgi:hypothetical protein
MAGHRGIPALYAGTTTVHLPGRDAVAPLARSVYGWENSQPEVDQAWDEGSLERHGPS